MTESATSSEYRHQSVTAQSQHSHSTVTSEYSHQSAFNKHVHEVAEVVLACTRHAARCSLFLFRVQLCPFALRSVGHVVRARFAEGTRGMRAARFQTPQTATSRSTQKAGMTTVTTWGRGYMRPHDDRKGRRNTPQQCSNQNSELSYPHRTWGSASQSQTATPTRLAAIPSTSTADGAGGLVASTSSSCHTATSTRWRWW